MPVMTSSDLSTSSSTSDIRTTNRHPAYWYSLGFFWGVLLLVAANAVSYFFYCRNILDLIGNNQRVDETIGFPFVFWTEKTATIEWSMIGLNLLCAVAMGMLGGIILAALVKRLNRSEQRAHDRRARIGGSIFQISMRSLLILTTAMAMVIGMLSYWKSIQRKPVESSNITSIGYSSTIKTLELEFTSGTVYQYFDVPRSVYLDLMKADSHGRFFSQYVRNEFEYEKQTVEESVTSSILMTIMFLGPVCLFSFGTLPNRIRWQTRYVLIGLGAVLLLGFACLGPLEQSQDPTRVMLGCLVFWLPQFAVMLTIHLLWLVRSGVETLANNAQSI